MPLREEPEREASFRAVANHVSLDDRLANIKTAPVAPLTNEQLLDCNAVADILVSVEDTVKDMVPGLLIANETVPWKPWRR